MLEMREVLAKYASDWLQSVSCQKPSRLIEAQELVLGAPLAQLK